MRRNIVLVFNDTLIQPPGLTNSSICPSDAADRLSWLLSLLPGAQSVISVYSSSPPPFPGASGQCLIESPGCLNDQRPAGVLADLVTCSSPLCSSDLPARILHEQLRVLAAQGCVCVSDRAVLIVCSTRLLPPAIHFNCLNQGF